MMLGSNPFNDVSKIYSNSTDFVKNCLRSKLQGTIIVAQVFIVSHCSKLIAINYRITLNSLVSFV